MSSIASTSKQNVFLDDDEIFEDSSILANFNNSAFKETSSKYAESNINESPNKSHLNVSALCCDEEISGYDKLTGRTWIYPTNYPVRDYQFNIIKASILKNTLVSLPTGLGKTFIAAVIMYNFYRWYPLGKIIFMAPTRPLVAQQIDACYNIIAIPPEDTIEMTGHMQVNTRKTHWQTKRVFFATPQVIYNDIKSGICPGDKIRCLVIDEAHRARGNYAYCQIVATLTDMGHKTYRVLALSATPGSKVEDVINVVKSLHIAHLELRTEGCIDVAPYSHTRRINTVVVQLGPELTQLRQQYVEILDGYARRLKQLNILPHNLGNISKGRIVMLYKEYQTKERGVRHPQHQYIMKDFTLLIALYHGLELLIKHGSRVFLNFFDEHPEKTWIQSDDRLTFLLERLRDDLGINPLSLDTSILPDGTIPEIPQNLCFGHPKFYKLKEIMMEHFSRAKENKQDTRAIVFCEYRESVNLVHCLLLQCRPLITPQMFVGQGASGKDGKAVVSQKQQLRVMRNFREGACNTLVATCVAEEGLDVGSVDLILCFDISTRSPIRLVQRCGRTGRERGGQVFILVTEGREHQTLLDCMRQRDALNNKVLQSKEVQGSLYKLNPRMMPHDFTPQCHKMFITVAKKEFKERDAADKTKKGQKDLRTMLLGRTSSSSSNSSVKDLEGTTILTESEFREICPEGYNKSLFFEEPKEYWSMSKETFKATSKAKEARRHNLSAWLEWQRTYQKTINIGHSKDTEILTSLLQFSDSKRFQLPTSTQNPSFNTQDFATQNFMTRTPTKISSPAKPKQQKKKQKIPLVRSPGKKDGDIRALFSTATKSTKKYTKLINDLGVQNDGSIPTAVISVLVDLSLNSLNTPKTCYICQYICECTIFKNMKKDKKLPNILTFIKEPKFPDVQLIDDIDVESILKCAKNDEKNDSLKDLDIHYQDVDNKNCSNNFELNFDFDSPIEITSSEKSNKKEIKDELEEKNFDIGDIEDIFADSSPEEIIKKDVEEIKDLNPTDPKKALGFFGLDSIDDIFADSDESVGHEIPTTPPKQMIRDKEVNDIVDNVPSNIEPQKSPSILSGRQMSSIPTSPILCSQSRRFNLSTNKKLQSSTPVSHIKKQLILETKEMDKTAITQEKEQKTIQSSLADTSNKSMLTITQLVEMINKTGNDNSISKSHTYKIHNQFNKEDDRSTSPILLTQAERKQSLSLGNDFYRSCTSQTKKCESLIILDSDSDSENDTQVYDLQDNLNKSDDIKSEMTELDSVGKNMLNAEVNSVKEPNAQDKLKSPVANKRKLEIEDNDLISNSPYFDKKQKLNNNTSKPLTLQEKILAALTSNKLNSDSFHKDSSVNFVLSPRKCMSQKENKSPTTLRNGSNFILRNGSNSDDEKEYVRKNNLEMLQMFRKGSTVKSPKKKLNIYLNSPKKRETPQKRKLTFDDSDDDFIEDIDSCRNKKTVNDLHDSSIINHKARKKKRKVNEFLDLEAELSDDGNDNSGDELSDDSIGSIVDFICDENITHHEDMQAHYMRSVKSPVNGVFKIPQLPRKVNDAEVLSQYVEEDNYEMDSFCVDSHIGLTQVNEISELELAEMMLEEKKAKKKLKSRSTEETGDESPVVRRRKHVKRLIHSDSEDSS